MGETLVDGFSDRGSIPLASTIKELNIDTIETP